MLRYAKVYGGKIDRKWVPPGAVGFENDLYTLPMYENMSTVQDIETKLFAYIDNYGALALGQLAAGQIPDDNRARTVFASFIFSLQRRTPHAIERLTRKVRTELEDQFGGLNLPRYNDALRLLALMRLFDMTEEEPTGRAIINMDWNLIKAPPDMSLLTSDEPVLFYGGPLIATGNAHIPISEIESFAMPVSPKHLLIGHWPARGLTGLEQMPPRSAVKTFNKYVVQAATALVIAADDTHTAFVCKHFGAAPRH